MRKGLQPGATLEDQRTARDKERWLRDCKVKAEQLYAAALARGFEREGRIFQHAAEQIVLHDNSKPFEFMSRMKHMPVTIDEFVHSPEFLGDLMEVWPTLMPDLRSMNPDVFVGEEPVFEALLGGATGCHAKGTMIRMFDGSTKAVEDVRVGDLLMGPDSLPRAVLALARGREPMARITPKRGADPFVVNLGHILSLVRTARKAGDARAGEIVNVTVRDWLGWSPWEKHIHKLRQVAVDFPAQSGASLSIPAYLLGVWLGDGDSDRACITSMDDEIMAACRHAAEAWGDLTREELLPNGNAASRICFRGAEGAAQSRFLSALKGLGLVGNKHIPARYLTASREVRREVLAGIIDTDGHLSCGGFEVVQKSTRMASDITSLARSLGFRVSCSPKVVSGATYQRLFISGDVGEIPVRLGRKMPPPSRRNRDQLVSGFSVDRLDEDDFYGFALSGDHLYLTADFIVHHNTGKTHLSQITIMKGAYNLSCFDQPQRLFRLTQATPLVFMLQSVSPTITKRVIYKPLREILTQMPFAQKWMPYDRYNESVLTFENNVVITPMQASLQALVGQAIPGAILDEVNFMQVVEQSKQVAGATGLGGRYDQAEVVYTNISRRRKRSFLTKGYSMGCICVVSSTRYLGDFLDRRIDEVRKFEERNILTLRRKQHEVAPPERYSGEKIRVLIGTPEYPTRVLEDTDIPGIHYPENALVETVPVELRVDFMRDPEAAQRDYLGIATAAITPYIRKRQKINDALSRGRDRNLPKLVEKDMVMLQTEGMPVFISENFPISAAERGKSRWVHVDLSRVKDRCGIAMVCLDGFLSQPVRAAEHVSETMPKFTVEFAVGIQPSPASEIDIAEVRGWVMRLIKDYGLNIEGVSFDGFDSQETIQAFRRSGIWSERISVDIAVAAYDNHRDMLYEDRVDYQPDCELLADEMRTLEYYPEKNKVDHPPRGTKDVSDAVTGAIGFALRSRRVRNGAEFVQTEPENSKAPRIRVRRERIRIVRERERR